MTNFVMSKNFLFILIGSLLQIRYCSGAFTHYVSRPALKRQLPSAFFNIKGITLKLNDGHYFSSIFQHIQQYTTTSQNKSNIDTVTEYDVENNQMWVNQNSRRLISNLLVCGDGDLSFSASVAKSLHNIKTNLIATVLEEQSVHSEVYQRSRANQEIILSHASHNVAFGVDATKLEEHFQSVKFDRIQFNFPHWRGKANHRYNRQLIDAFLKSASLVLAPNGEIHMALCEGQGGSNSKNLKEYRDTWTPAFFASQHGLMLMDVLPFSPSYNLSSHRGVDRGFKIGKIPEMYIFAKPNQIYPVRRIDQMMCCRHELHIVLPENFDHLDRHGKSQYSTIDFTEGDALLEIIKTVIPTGIRIEIPERRILTKETTGYAFDLIVYLVVYGGESRLLSRDEADSYRHHVEIEVCKYIPLRENRTGRLVSRPFPYYLLQSIIDDHNS